MSLGFSKILGKLEVKYVPTYIKGTLLKEKVYITKACLYNVDPLKPHFYIVKLGFTGVYIIFLISAQKQRLWILVRTASSTFEQKFEKILEFLYENYHFLVVKFSVYLNRRGL